MSGFHAQEQRCVMTSYDEFFGNYLKKSDVKGEVTVAIIQVKPEMVGRGKDSKEKLVAYLKGFDKPLIVNQGNAKAIAEIAGSSEIEDWAGKKIVLYVDPKVKFGSDEVGGIRVKAVLPSPAASQAVKPA